MIINEEDGIIYEVFSVGFHTNNSLGIITTDGFATTRVNTPVIKIKNSDDIIQTYRLPLELECWVLSCMRSASAGKNPFPCKVALGIINNEFHVEFK